MGRILVIRGGAIGDFILTLPAIRLLRENFPEAHLEILGYKHIVSLAEGRYYAQATRCIEYAPMAGFFVPDSSLDAELASYFGSFNQVISYLYDPDGFFENNLRRIGVRYFLKGSPRLDNGSHAAKQLAEPLRSLALYLENPAAAIFPNDEDRSFAERFLGESQTPVIALHPGSGSPRKNWPLENWLALGRHLHTTGVELLVVGGEADGPAVEFLRKGWEFPVRIAEGLPLTRLGAVLGRCALFLGHDSGISHLAAAAGAPCLLLFGPTDPVVWAPANPKIRVMRAPDGVLGRLRLQEIVDAISLGQL